MKSPVNNQFLFLLVRGGVLILKNTVITVVPGSGGGGVLHVYCVLVYT
jgi:hypothetical protein